MAMPVNSLDLPTTSVGPGGGPASESVSSNQKARSVPQMHNPEPRFAKCKCCVCLVAARIFRAEARGDANIWPISGTSQRMHKLELMALPSCAALSFPFVCRFVRTMVNPSLILIHHPTDRKLILFVLVWSLSMPRCCVNPKTSDWRASSNSSSVLRS